MKYRNKYLSALKAAFPYTIPIFAGFWFLSLTYGIYMNVSGFRFWYPILMSLTIFAGSIEFAAVNMLLGAFNPLQAPIMTIMINARHANPLTDILKSLTSSYKTCKLGCYPSFLIDTK